MIRFGIWSIVGAGCAWTATGNAHLPGSPPVVPDTSVEAVPPDEALRSWTIAVWMDGDNDLEPMVFPDLDELERGAGDGLSILVQVDRIEGYDDRHGEWTGTRRFEIVPDMEPGLASPVVEDLGEVDMGDPEALADFLLWADAGWPSDHFALVLWNHGGGFWIASDDTDGSKMELDGEVQSALAALTAVRGEPLDVVAFDACNMAQWETAHSFDGLADVLVASEAWIGFAGFAYDAAFPALAPGHGAVELGDLLAWSAGDVNGEATEGAIDLREVPALSDAIDRLAGVVLADDVLLGEWAAARDRALGTDRLYDDFWMDLGSLADELVATGHPELVFAAGDVRAALDAALISIYTNDTLSFASGLTIYADTNVPAWMEAYRGGPWAQTRWDEMIESVAAWERGRPAL